jgi:hypothetical protein
MRMVGNKIVMKGGEKRCSGIRSQRRKKRRNWQGQETYPVQFKIIS